MTIMPLPAPLPSDGYDTDAEAPVDAALEADPSLQGSGGVADERARQERKRKWTEARQLEEQMAKRERKDGAILASTRTAEGYSLPSGNQLTCKPDAVFNALQTLGFEGASLARLRSLSVPQLGLHPMASWDSVSAALSALGYPFALSEATSRFKGPGGPLLNLLCAPRGVYIVSLLVIVGDARNKHSVMLSTVRERHAPFGKLVDNHGKMVPAYIQKRDRNGKEAARRAWWLFVGQNPALHDRSFAVEPIDVYEVRATI